MSLGRPWLKAIMHDFGVIGGEVCVNMVMRCAALTDLTPSFSISVSTWE